MRRGIDRGDLRPDADVDIATELLVGPVYFRLVFGGSLDGDLAERVVTAFLDGYAVSDDRGAAFPGKLTERSSRADPQWVALGYVADAPGRTRYRSADEDSARWDGFPFRPATSSSAPGPRAAPRGCR